MPSRSSSFAPAGAFRPTRRIADACVHSVQILQWDQFRGNMRCRPLYVCAASEMMQLAVHVLSIYMNLLRLYYVALSRELRGRAREAEGRYGPSVAEHGALSPSFAGECPFVLGPPGSARWALS